jgi:hypothetical protein
MPATSTRSDAPPHFEQSVFNVEEELRGRGMVSLRRCREADRQDRCGWRPLGNMTGGIDECQAETSAIRVP